LASVVEQREQAFALGDLMQAGPRQFGRRWRGGTAGMRRARRRVFSASITVTRIMRRHLWLPPPTL
jgi:hypothetical protein